MECRRVRSSRFLSAYTKISLFCLRATHFDNNNNSNKTRLEGCRERWRGRF